MWSFSSYFWVIVGKSIRSKRLSLFVMVTQVVRDQIWYLKSQCSSAIFHVEIIKCTFNFLLALQKFLHIHYLTFFLQAPHEIVSAGFIILTDRWGNWGPGRLSGLSRACYFFGRRHHFCWKEHVWEKRHQFRKQSVLESCLFPSAQSCPHYLNFLKSVSFTEIPINEMKHTKQQQHLTY